MPQQNQKHAESIDENSPTPENYCTEETPEYSLFYTQGWNTPAPILVTLKVSGIDLEMELDTEATLSVISEQTYHKLFSSGKAPPLKTVITQLTWGGH